LLFSVVDMFKWSNSLSNLIAKWNKLLHIEITILSDLATHFSCLRALFLSDLHQNIKGDEELICIVKDVSYFSRIDIIPTLFNVHIQNVCSVIVFYFFYCEFFTSQFYLLWVNYSNGFNAIALSELTDYLIRISKELTRDREIGVS